MKNTIFLGNGFNRCLENCVSWEELLNVESQNTGVMEVGEFDKSLYTLFYE